MDFTLYEDKKSAVKTLISVHIGPYTISVLRYSWDKTFESEHTIKAISIGKMLKATGTADIEALKEYMLNNFGSKNGYEDISRFLTQHKIRCEHDGYTRYE